MSEVNNSRRQFVQKVAYTAPLILTVSVMPAFAKTGSAHCDNGVGPPPADPDCNPPGLVDKPLNNNDDTFGTPGGPQNQGGNH